MRVVLLKILFNVLILSFILCVQLFADFKCEERLINHNKIYNPKLGFYIEKNHNKNITFFDINFDENGLINPEEPLDIYWRLFAKKGERSEIKFIEKKLAFGLNNVKEIDPGRHYSGRIASMDRNIQIKNYDNCSWIETDINGKPSRLEYIMLELGGFVSFATLISMDLYGEDLKSGKLNAERWYYDKELRYKNTDVPPDIEINIY